MKSFCARYTMHTAAFFALFYHIFLFCAIPLKKIFGKICIIFSPAAKTRRLLRLRQAALLSDCRKNRPNCLFFSGPATKKHDFSAFLFFFAQFCIRCAKTVQNIFAGGKNAKKQTFLFACWKELCYNAVNKFGKNLAFAHKQRCAHEVRKK